MTREEDHGTLSFLCKLMNEKDISFLHYEHGTLKIQINARGGSEQGPSALPKPLTDDEILLDPYKGL